MKIKELLLLLGAELNTLDIEQKIDALNRIKSFLHHLSPFKYEPVDCVIWVKREQVIANDYNPNVMSPTEKRLLETSLAKDGYTQPIVALLRKQLNQEDPNVQWQVVDGYHRYLLGNKGEVKKRLNGYLPVTEILSGDNEDGSIAELMATTIRHNRARGQHHVTAMSDIVRELCRLGWNDQRIGDELGMSLDEVLRLKQISGLAELFLDKDFSTAWTVK